MADTRPLLAKRIVVTRAAQQSAALLDRLRALGAIPVAAPAIRILPPDDPQPLRDAVAQLEAFTWLVCTSANGVRAALGAHNALGVRWPSALRVAAVGSATARAFAEAEVRVEFTPSTAVAEALGRELPLADAASVLWPRGDLAARDLAVALEARGARVTDPVAYRTVADVGLLGIVDALRDRRIDALTFASASTVRHVVEGLAAAGVRLDRADPATRPRVVCIGPVTAAAARECGLIVDAIAEPSDDEGLVSALVRCFTSSTAPA